MRFSPARLWPAALVAVLAITVLANVVIFRLANDPVGLSVEPDAYARAVAWDSTAAERDASGALGWSAVARLDAVPGGARVVVELRDRAGAPVRGARVRVEAIHNDLARRFEGALPAAASGPDGAYAAVLPLPHAGLWELRLHAAQGDARFVTSLRAELGRLAR